MGQPAAIKMPPSQTVASLTNTDVISVRDEPYMAACSHGASYSLETSQSTEKKQV